MRFRELSYTLQWVPLQYKKRVENTGLNVTKEINSAKFSQRNCSLLPSRLQFAATVTRLRVVFIVLDDSTMCSFATAKPQINKYTKRSSLLHSDREHGGSLRSAVNYRGEKTTQFFFEIQHDRPTELTKYLHNFKISARRRKQFLNADG